MTEDFINLELAKRIRGLWLVEEDYYFREGTPDYPTVTHYNNENWNPYENREQAEDCLTSWTLNVRGSEYRRSSVIFEGEEIICYLFFGKGYLLHGRDKVEDAVVTGGRCTNVPAAICLALMAFLERVDE